MSDTTGSSGSRLSSLVRAIVIGSKFAAPAGVYGLGTAVAMWVVFFVTHLPGLDTPPIVVGIALLGCMVIGAGIAGRQFGRTLGWRVGMASGWTTLKFNLLLIGAFITKAPEQVTAGQTDPAQGVSGFSMASLGPVAGFSIASVAIALIAGFVGSVSQPRREAAEFDLTSGTWLPRFAAMTSVVFLPLILIGGLVSTTGSGMSVRGWPASDGANMFLYPISLMTSHNSIFLEHSHRLFGTLAGLATLLLTIWVTLGTSNKLLKGLAWAVLALVVVQGVLGGFRVTEASLVLALLHGVAGQVTFAAAVALSVCLYLSNRPLLSQPILNDDRKLKSFAAGLVHATLLQLALGAAFRHLRLDGSSGANHALWAHMGFSIAVVVMAALAATFARSVAREHRDSTLMRLSTGLIACIAIQFAIGWLAFFFVCAGHSKDQTILQPDQLATTQIAIPVHEILTRTLHQANGAVLFCLASATYVIALFNLRRAKATEMAVPSPTH